MIQPPRKRADWLHPGVIALIVMATTLVAGWPLTSAGFFQDDWLLLAMARHMDHPGVPYVNGMLHEFFYRPSWLALWWFSERLLGHDAAGHYLFSVMLHGGSGVLLSVLVLRISHSRLAALVAGLVFVVSPPALGSVIWLANRNELLAVFAGLAALVVVERSRQDVATALLLGLCLFVSVTAKENGLLFAGLAFLRLIHRQRTGGAVPIRLWLATITPPLVMLAMRSATIVPVAIGVTWESIRQHAGTGILAWFELLPRAIHGLGQAQASGWLLVFCLAACAAIAIMTLVCRRGHGALLAYGLLLLLLPPFLQWPITHLLLPNELAHEVVLNLRFYYVSAVGMALLLAAACASRGAVWQGPAMAAAALALIITLPRSQHLAAHWADFSGAASREVIDLSSRLLAQADCSPGQRVVLDSDHWPMHFPRFADAAVKAVAERGSAWLGCPVSTTADTPNVILLDGRLCSQAHWPGLPVALSGGHLPRIRPMGGLCLVSFQSLHGDDPLQLRIHL